MNAPAQPKDVEGRQADCALQKSRSMEVAIARLQLNMAEVAQAQARARRCELRIQTKAYEKDHGKVCHLGENGSKGHPLDLDELLHRELSELEAHLNHAHRLMEYAKSYYMIHIV